MVCFKCPKNKWGVGVKSALKLWERISNPVNVLRSNWVIEDPETYNPSKDSSCPQCEDVGAHE